MKDTNKHRGSTKTLASMLQLPNPAMDRLPLALQFSTSELLMRYPLVFPTAAAAAQCQSMSDFKLRLPTSLATDPRLWSREDVSYFLRWCETEFDLPPFDMDLFQMNGKALCFLTKTDITERCPTSGGVLYNVLHMLVRQVNTVQRYLPTSPNTPAAQRSRYPAGSFNSLQYGGNWSLYDLYQQNAAPMLNNSAANNVVNDSVTLSPVPSTDSQSHSPEHNTDNQGSSGFGSGGSTGSRHSDSEEETYVDTSPSAAAPASSPPPPSVTPKSPSPRSPATHQKSSAGYWQHPHNNNNNNQQQQQQQQPTTQHFFPPTNIQHEPNTNGRLLWDFLQQLLNDPAQRYTNFIAWKNHDTGVFKIVDPAGLAKLWGIQKNHLSMNYDKMSRALRYYYRVNILRKVQGERHCYQFLRNPSELKSIKNISLLRQQITMQQQQQQQQQQPTKQEVPDVREDAYTNEPTDLSTKEGYDRSVQESVNLQRVRQHYHPSALPQYTPSTTSTSTPAGVKMEPDAERTDEPTDLTSPRSLPTDTMRLSIVKTENVQEQ